jgi:hypothetical protein
MQINDSDLGKIVQLPARPEWGLGIITKVQNRFAYIIFRDTPERAAKKYFRAENPLNLAKDQDQPDLNKRARSKNNKVRPGFSRKAKNAKEALDKEAEAKEKEAVAQD